MIRFKFWRGLPGYVHIGPHLEICGRDLFNEATITGVRSIANIAKLLRDEARRNEVADTMEVWVKAAIAGDTFSTVAGRVFDFLPEHIHVYQSVLADSNCVSDVKAIYKLSAFLRDNYRCIQMAKKIECWVRRLLSVEGWDISNGL